MAASNMADKPNYRFENDARRYENIIFVTKIIAIFSSE